MKEMRRQCNLPLVGENKEATLGMPPFSIKNQQSWVHVQRKVCEGADVRGPVIVIPDVL